MVPIIIIYMLLLHLPHLGEPRLCVNRAGAGSHRGQALRQEPPLPVRPPHHNHLNLLHFAQISIT